MALPRYSNLMAMQPEIRQLPVSKNTDNDFEKLTTQAGSARIFNTIKLKQDDQNILQDGDLTVIVQVVFYQMFKIQNEGQDRRRFPKI